LLQQLAGGSFDGTYSVTGLPIGSGSINFSSWLLNLRNGSGTILQTLSNSLPGSSAFAEQGSAYYGLGDVLAFQDASYQLQLEFAPGFTGTGAIRPGQRGSSYSAHLTRSGSSAILLTSGSSQSVLPGLVGMGVAAFRRRRGEVQPAAD
jgi:hypothetical protein